MKLVGTSKKAEEAHLLRAHLEGSGIAAFVRDDLTIATDWALSNAIGGVKVEVADDDYDAAQSLIASFNPAPMPRSEEKKKHPFDRYLKVFAATFIATYAYIVWRWSPAALDVYGTMLIPAIILAGCVSGFAALLDL